MCTMDWEKDTGITEDIDIMMPIESSALDSAAHRQNDKNAVFLIAGILGLLFMVCCMLAVINRKRKKEIKKQHHEWNTRQRQQNWNTHPGKLFVIVTIGIWQLKLSSNQTENEKHEEVLVLFN